MPIVCYSDLRLNRVALKVNKMTSITTMLPLEYYSLPYCAPLDGVKRDNQNLGQFLSGDRIANSPYFLRMRTDMYCEQLCVSNLGPTEQPSVTPNKFVKAIRNMYRNNWIVDNLPSAFKFWNGTTVQTRYWPDIPIGFIHTTDHKAYVFNHVNIEIEYHAVEGKTDAYRIVRFMVEPFSIAHETGERIKYPDDFDISTANHLPMKTRIKNPIPSCDLKWRKLEHTSVYMIVKLQPASGEVLFTYDVIWTENPDLRWTSRWDIYLSMNHRIPTQDHWINFLFGIATVLAVSAVAVCKLIVILRSNTSNSEDSEILVENNRTVEDFGWKAVRSDVFRPPPPIIFTNVVGGWLW